MTARVKILELPERAQQLIGEDVIPLAAVDQLRAIGTVAPELLDAVIAYLDDGNAWAAERLTREPGWVLDAALTHAGDSKVFAAYLHSAGAREIAELRLGKKTEQLYAEAEKLHKQLDRYAYGPPQVRFTDADVDQARAAGVLIEFERGRPIIVDRPLYRELVKAAIKRTHDDARGEGRRRPPKEKTTARAGQAARRPGDGGQARARRAAARADRPGARRQPRPRPRADPQPHQRRPDRHRRRAVLRLRAARRRPRQLARTRRPASGSPGSPPAASGWSSTSCAPTSPRRARTAAAAGCAIDYGDHRDPQAAIAWLWKFIDGAKTAGELYGRALVVIAAEQYASRLVLPASQRGPRSPWTSHKDIAAKALKKLAGPHLPASLSAAGAGRQARPRGLRRRGASSAPRAERERRAPTSSPRRRAG